MKAPKRPDLFERLLELVRLLSSFDLPTLLARALDLVRALRRLLRRHAYHYSYETLELETTVELCDPEGDRAIVRRRKRFRFLQDDVTLVAERLCGTGFFFRGLSCSSGVAVDFYRGGSRWTVLISPQETKKRGDVLLLETARTMLGTFYGDRCWWEEEIFQPTEHTGVSIISGVPSYRNAIRWGFGVDRPHLQAIQWLRWPSWPSRSRICSRPGWFLLWCSPLPQSHRQKGHRHVEAGHRG